MISDGHNLPFELLAIFHTKQAPSETSRCWFYFSYPPWRGGPPSPPERKVLAKSADFVAHRLSICWKTDVKERGFTPWCGFHTRDRSVTAGRSHFLIASLSFYMLLGDCQDIVGHREGDFDFRSFLSYIFLYVTSILICLRRGDPEVSLLIHPQIVQ